MFWGLSAGVVDTGDFSFEHVLEDIQTLNEWALEGRLEVTAISLHAYPFVQDRYVILPHGASMGSGYGPIVVSTEPLTRSDLKDIAGYVDDSGEGRWTIFEAINEDVPVPVISAALYARFASRQDESFAAKINAALRQQFGGHPVKSEP